MNILKRNESGFSLVEVLVASGIMGVMAVFFYKSFNDNMKQQKTVLSRMEETNLINEIRVLLMNQDNCAETLKGQRFSLNIKEKDDLERPIDFLQKVMYSPSLDEKTPKKKVTKEKFHIYKKGTSEIVHGNARAKISKYSLQYDKKVVENLKAVSQEEVNFLVTFKRGSLNFGTKEKSYKIPLAVSVDSALNLESCSSLGLPSSGKAGILAIDANTSPSLINKSGNDACKSKGMDCAYVQSTNYVVNTRGLDAPLYTPACLSSYNIKLDGVKLGVALSNVHSCDAKIGTHQTFQLDVNESTSIICGGTFVAFCN
jgi:prepilin-type N-terminal cleavage/methylation domain-containing protein